MHRKGQTKKPDVSQGPLQIYNIQPLTLITSTIPSTRLRTDSRFSIFPLPHGRVPFAMLLGLALDSLLTSVSVSSRTASFAVHEKPWP